MKDTEKPKARQLVEMLRDMSHDPDAAGAEAIPAWRVEAASHGDLRLVAEMDAYGEDQLIELWDHGSGYACSAAFRAKWPGFLP